MKKTIYSLFAAILLCAGFTGCGDDDDKVKLPDVAVSFNTSELGIADDAKSVEATINLSRAYTAALDVTVKVEPDGVTYGDHFTTTPAVQDGQIKVTVPAGSTNASFNISSVKDILLEGTESIKFSIQSVSATEGVVLGDKKDLKLSFGAILSEGETLTLQGRTNESNYANTVYVDFSTNTQVAIDRKSWALGFYSGADHFRVFLNSALQMAAAATTKTDIKAVNTADLEGLPALVPVMMEGKFIDLANVDDLKGNISKTAIAEVSATDAENKVHILAMENPETSKTTYYKVRVMRASTGYKVEYGLLDGTETNTTEISKNADYNLVGFSFKDKKTVPAEPKSKNWDVMWTYGTGVTSVSGKGVAYFMQDLVLLNNLGGAVASEVLTSSDDEYSKLTLEKAKTLPYKNEKNIIGTNWRVTAKMGGSTEEVGVRKNRFYVVKDPAGNYYKLRFNKMGLNNDGGVRGNPELEYALLK